MKQVEKEEHTGSTLCCSLGLCLDTEDGDDMFLRSVGWRTGLHGVIS